ncbi:MAG: peptidylprolyl isomerase [Polyangiaceae bacterium]|nr:peptidylprolyl isomerase [Polyangiaceae bacterium]
MTEMNVNPMGKRCGLWTLGWLLAAALALPACGKPARVLAKVSAREVTQPEFDAYLRFKRIPADNAARRDAALTEYLEREALAETISAEGKLDRDLVRAELRELEKEMLISRYFSRFLEEKVTETSIRNYYEARAKDFESRQVHVAHVLIRARRGMSDEERQAKLTSAQEVYSKLQAGEDFGKLAEQYSEDRVSGKKGGDLGWIKPGGIAEELSKRAFELAPGTVSPPFETRFGFHVLKVLEAPRTVKQPLRAVQGDIRHRLATEAKRAELERLQQIAKVERKEPYLEAAPAASASAQPGPRAPRSAASR